MNSTYSDWAPQHRAEAVLHQTIIAERPRPQRGLVAWLNQSLDYKPWGVYTLRKNFDGTWPKRPTADPRVTFVWAGNHPLPEVGDDGMMENVDIAYITD